jgi:hypothetical protein
VKWSGGWLVLGAALTCEWLVLKSAEDLSHYSQWGTTVRTLVDCPMGRLAWTNHILLPNNPARAVVLLHHCTNRGGWIRILGFVLILWFRPYPGMFQGWVSRLAVPHRVLLGREPQGNLGTGGPERWQKSGKELKSFLLGFFLIYLCQKRSDPRSFIF